MKSWLSIDDQGRSVLMRQGAGRVVAVVPIGLVSADEASSLYRVEIEVARPAGAPRAIRLSTHAMVVASDPLLQVALQAEDCGDELAWQIAWHRLPWVPDDIEITSLDLANEAQAWLRCLAPAESAISDDLSREASAFADLVRTVEEPDAFGSVG